MLPYRSTLVLVTCFSCLSFVSSLGKSTKLYEPASASSQAGLFTSVEVEQAKPVASKPPVLDPGTRGSEVIELQTKLKQLGYYDGTVDGVYGESTVQAVTKFQKSAGFKADGIAGSTTWNRLQTALSENKPPSATTGPQKPAKPGKKTNVWLIASLAIAFTSVAVGLFLVYRWFGKKTHLMRPELEPTPHTKEPNIFESRNGRATGISTDSNMPLLDTSKNGHVGTPELAKDNEDFPFSPVSQNLLPPSHLSSSSPSELTEGGKTPIDETSVEKTTRLPKINIVDELITDLQSPDPVQRRKAIWELAQQGDSRAIQPLVDLIIDSDSQQRSLILEAVSQIGVRTLKPMNRALAVSLQDENAQVRKNAIRDLTRVYEMITQINYLLRHALEDPDAEVKETGKWALEQLNRIRNSSGVEGFSASPNSEGSSNKPPEE